MSEKELAKKIIEPAAMWHRLVQCWQWQLRLYPIKPNRWHILPVCLLCLALQSLQYSGCGEPQYYKRGYNTEHNCSIPNVSFDDFPFEYPIRGHGDYRIPAFALDILKHNYLIPYVFHFLSTGGMGTAVSRVSADRGTS